MNESYLGSARRHAPAFRRAFGTGLGLYWAFPEGFNVVAFDAHVGTPDDATTLAHVTARYGAAAADMVAELCALNPFRDLAARAGVALA